MASDGLRRWNAWKLEQVKAVPARRRRELRGLLDDIRDDRGHSIGITADELRRVKEITGMGGKE